MKCELCDAEGVVHTTEIHEDGDCLTGHLCIDHAREAGYPFPTADEMHASVISKKRLLAEFLRKNRRMPSPNELTGMGGYIEPPRQDTEQDIDAYIAYFETLADFVNQHARLPKDGEIQDPF